VYPVDHDAPVAAELDAETIAEVRAASWIGRANRLSADHVDWDIIDVVESATRKARTLTDGQRDAAKESIADCELRIADSQRSVPLLNRQSEIRNPQSRPCGMTARAVIRQRRSAVAFDGETSIAAEAFYAMLGRVMPGRDCVPFDVVGWPARIHLLLFVHLVAGIRPGLYALVRDPAKTDELRRAMKPAFVWTKPAACAEELPLYLLLEADCRRAAAQLSLGQEIAGMSAFSLGMVADFDAALAEHGLWYYRRLYWEAGLVGQVLYLEAEAVGVRATGIGAYFDDLVHDVFGLADHRFQSMYHFTVGGPVDDSRLTTLPAYPQGR
jgi:hypothetical protein